MTPKEHILPEKDKKKLDNGVRKEGRKVCLGRKQKAKYLYNMNCLLRFVDVVVV